MKKEINTKVDMTLHKQMIEKGNAYFNGYLKVPIRCTS